jgi:predicted cupin superfamily sugar epimerase
MLDSVKELVSHFDLLPHPEGGFYKELYRSTGIIPKDALNPAFKGDRNYCTSIYFLLTSDNFSGFHRIQQDEIWHFYAGATLLVHVIDPEGNYSCNHVGMDITKGEAPQFVVPANSWFASEVKEANAYSFVGCTVAPGFDFEDFELAERKALEQEYPAHSEIVEKLTRQ